MSIGKTATIVGGAISAISIGLVKAASDAEETANKFAVVFKDVSEAAEKSAKNLRDNFGLSSRAAKQLLSDTGDLLTGFGFTGDAALDLSTKVNELAVDLASFTNYSGGAEGASAALTKALLGERESVKSLGISILETDVQAKVLEMTKKGLTFETERQAKAYATLLIAQEQSKNAMGDFARTQDSFANQSRVLKARLDDVVVTLGNALLPIANELIGTVTEIVQNVSKWIEENKTLVTWIVKIIATLGALAAVGGPILMAAAAFMKLKGIIMAVQKILVGAGGLNAAILLVTANIIIWTEVAKELDEILHSTHTSAADVTNALNLQADAQQALADKLGITVDELKEFQKAGASVSEMLGEDLNKNIEKTADFTKDFVDSFEKSVPNALKIAQEVIEEYNETLSKHEKQVIAINDKYDALIDETQELIDNEEELAEAINTLEEARQAELAMLDETIATQNELNQLRDKAKDAIQNITDAIFEMTNTDYDVAIRDLNREFEGHIQILKDAGLEEDVYKEKVKEAEEWLRLKTEALKEQYAPQKELNDVINDGTKVLGDYNKKQEKTIETTQRLGANLNNTMTIAQQLMTRMKRLSSMASGGQVGEMATGGQTTAAGGAGMAGYSQFLFISTALHTYPKPDSISFIRARQLFRLIRILITTHFHLLLIYPFKVAEVLPI